MREENKLSQRDIEKRTGLLRRERRPLTAADMGETKCGCWLNCGRSGMRGTAVQSGAKDSRGTAQRMGGLRWPRTRLRAYVANPVVEILPEIFGMPTRRRVPCVRNGLWLRITMAMSL